MFPAFASLAAEAGAVGVVSFNGHQLQDTRALAWPEGDAAPCAPSDDDALLPPGNGPLVGFARDGAASPRPADQFFTTRQAGGERALGAAAPARASSSLAALPRGSRARRSLAAAAPAAGGASSAAARRVGRALRARGRRRRRGAAGAGRVARLCDVAPGLHDRQRRVLLLQPRAEPHVRADGRARARRARGARRARASCSSTRWYEKADDGGLLAWTPMREVFPDGLDGGAAMRGAPLVLHNRWVSPRSAYYTEGGPGGAHACAASDAARDAAARRRRAPDSRPAAASWGMVVYEQDFLTKQYESVAARQPAGRAATRTRTRGARRRARVRARGSSAWGRRRTRSRRAAALGHAHALHARPHARRGGRARVRRAQRAALWSVGSCRTRRLLVDRAEPGRAPCADGDRACGGAAKAPHPGAAGRGRARPRARGRAQHAARGAGHAVRRGRPPQRVAHRAGVRRRRRAARPTARSRSSTARSRRAERALAARAAAAAGGEAANVSASAGSRRLS